MLWLYRLLFFPLLLVMAPYYYRRMRKRGGYREGMRERFGQTPPLPPKQANVTRIWIQAVSVGEMLAIGPLIEGLLARGRTEIYLTTTTSTGRALAKERYGKKVIAVANFPTDAWIFSSKAWDAIQPDLCLLTEGERWPEHLAQARKRGCPVVAVNARLSDRSFRRMRRARSLLLSLWRGYTRILAASDLDAARFAELGFAKERIVVTGNLKLDLTLVRIDAARQGQLREELGLGSDPILLGSSTWPGEEALLLEAFGKIRASDPRARLLLVPRHAERRDEVDTLLRGSGLAYHFRSRGRAPGLVDVAVGDTTGELRALTQLASLVVVGKSFPPHTEGQTPVEAAALGRPILFGPGMANFRAIAGELVERGAAQAATADELVAVVSELWQDEVRRREMGQAAQDWLDANRGALAKTLAELAPYIRA